MNYKDKDKAKKLTPYIVKNKNLINIKRNELRMLSTNFCNGGDEIYEIKNLED